MPDRDPNPYQPPHASDTNPIGHSRQSHRGPLIYFACSGLIAIAFAIPLVAPISISKDPNPLGYLLILLSIPLGGIVYRLRSKNWPVDPTVRGRQMYASLATTLLPIGITLLTGLRGQGLALMLISCILALTIVAAIFISGMRRCR